MTRDEALDLAISVLDYWKDHYQANEKYVLEAIAVLTQMQGDLSALPMFAEREDYSWIKKGQKRYCLCGEEVEWIEAGKASGWLHKYPNNITPLHPVELKE